MLGLLLLIFVDLVVVSKYLAQLAHEIPEVIAYGPLPAPDVPLPTEAQSERESEPKTKKKSSETESVAATQTSKYPLHSNIKATIFWVGEDATADNDFIDNYSSAWASDWIKLFGGVDTPKKRNGWHPAGFKPKENPFYIALPYGDYTEKGLKKNVKKAYWYEGVIPDGGSIIKNRWVKINRLGKTVYAQWEDVGPFNDNDVKYVFGTGKSTADVGIDLSPATAEYIGLPGLGLVSWQFVDAKDVPDGPWTEIVTKSGPKYD